MKRRIRKRSRREQDYNRFIRSAAWQRIRKAKLREQNWLCEVCPQEPKKLATQVHHKHYSRFGGQELLIDLMAVCEDCHRWLEDVKRQERKTEVELSRAGMPRLWHSFGVNAAHAKTQVGVDIRQRLIDQYRAISES